MDTYIVRVYRRNSQYPNSITGILEEVGTDKQRPFNDIKEVCAILTKVERDTVKKQVNKAD